MITVSLATVLCAILAMIAVGSQGLGTWMGPVIVIGGVAAISLAVLAWWGHSDRDRLSRTTYAVTSHRILVFEDGLHDSPRELDLDGPQPRCEDNGDGTVSIWLAFHNLEDGSFDKTGRPMIDRELTFVGLERLSDHASALNAIIEARTAKFGLWSASDIVT